MRVPDPVRLQRLGAHVQERLAVEPLLHERHAEPLEDVQAEKVQLHDERRAGEFLFVRARRRVERREIKIVVVVVVARRRAAF